MAVLAIKNGQDVNENERLDVVNALKTKRDRAIVTARKVMCCLPFVMLVDIA